MLHDAHQALVVDPGDAQPVLAVLQHLSVQLEAILVTHHHLDHTGAVDALRQAIGAKVFGPAREPMPEPMAEPLTRLIGGDRLQPLTRYTVTAQGMRSRQQPTLPSTIRLERQINPFFAHARSRCHAGGPRL